MRKKATLIFVLRCVRLVIAVINLSFSAKYFGVNFERDVWLLALTSVIVLDTIIWGAINDTFRAKFTFLKDREGEALALDRAKALLLFINVITILVLGLVMSFPGGIAKMFAPSYTPEQLHALVVMIRIVAPSFLLTQVTKIITSILNAYGSFVIPEIIGLFTQLLTLILVVLFAESIGIYTLVISYYAGLIVLTILLVRQLRALNVRLFYGLSKVRFSHFKPFLLFSVPLFFIYLSSQIGIVIERALASSTAVGAVSALDYSRKFSDIPIEVLCGIIASLLVPILTQRYVKQDHQSFIEEFRKIYQFGLLVLIFVVGIFTACPGAVVRLLYRQGSISQQSLDDIARLTMYYSWSAIFVFLYHMYGSALLSSQKGIRFALFGTVAQLIMILMNLTLYDKFSFYLFPFSLLISHGTAAVIMALQFPVAAKQLVTVTLKYLAILSGVCGFAWAFNHYVYQSPHAFVTISLTTTILAVLTLIAVFVLKTEERAVMLSLFKRRFFDQ
ncbi:lipid II flippase MurJ [Pedobacter deserti]|uniref:lipid II flippase MurJ n=1 Tax=Pedobacter deserti TaxID=2817382 RepID=UPI00210EEBF8|nr:lipid II flippase MurJ [Pedobacter sp. SYSU D00382]